MTKFANPLWPALRPIADFIYRHPELHEEFMQIMQHPLQVAEVEKTDDIRMCAEKMQKEQEEGIEHAPRIVYQEPDASLHNLRSLMAFSMFETAFEDTNKDLAELGIRVFDTSREFAESAMVHSHNNAEILKARMKHSH